MRQQKFANSLAKQEKRYTLTLRILSEYTPTSWELQTTSENTCEVLQGEGLKRRLKLGKRTD